MEQSFEERNKETEALFLESFVRDKPLVLEYFRSCQIPIAIAEASVEEYVIEDFNVLQLLVLRLYDAGFRSAKDMAALCGMREEMVEKALENEITVSGHIDDYLEEITETGRTTLETCAEGTMRSHSIYTTVRRIQIEAATGTVVPAYLEEQDDRMKMWLKDDQDGIVPQESVEQDEELRREINERLEEYRSKDILNEKATIRSINDLHSAQILYRWAYLAKFYGMKYPMIVMQGHRTVDNVNDKSKKEGDYGKKVALPLAVSRSDEGFFSELGVELGKVLVREDHFFEYLDQQVNDILYPEETELEPLQTEDEDTDDLFGDDLDDFEDEYDEE